MKTTLRVLIIFLFPLSLNAQDTTLVKNGSLSREEFYLLKLETQQVNNTKPQQEMEITLPENFNINGLGDSALSNELKKLTYAQQLLAMEKGIIPRQSSASNNQPAYELPVIKCDNCADSTRQRMLNEYNPNTQIEQSGAAYSAKWDELKVVYKNEHLKIILHNNAQQPGTITSTIKEYDKASNKVKLIDSSVLEASQKNYLKNISYTPASLDAVLIINISENNQTVINKIISINNISNSDEN
jgi:hypothetical protein